MFFRLQSKRGRLWRLSITCPSGAVNRQSTRQRKHIVVTASLDVLDPGQLRRQKAALAAEKLLLCGPARLAPGKKPINQRQEQQHRARREIAGIEIVRPLWRRSISMAPTIRVIR